MKIFLLILLSIICSSTCIFAQEFDSTKDFSNKHNNNWSYGYIEENNYSQNNIILFDNFENNMWYVKNEFNIPQITQKHLHPSNEYMTVLRWTAPKTGNIQLSLTQEMLNKDKQSDGITGIIYINGKEVDRKLTNPKDTIPQRLKKNYKITKNDTVDYVVSCNKNSGADLIGYNLNINYFDMPVDEYIWIHSEDLSKSNWQPGTVLESNINIDGTSNGTMFSLTTQDEKGIPYYVEYEIDIKNPKVYSVWMASTPMKEDWVSPFNFYIDKKIVNQTNLDKSNFSRYTALSMPNVFEWAKFGDFNLSKGKHTIRIEVKEKRKSDNLLIFYIDTLLVTSDKNYVPTGNVPKLANWDYNIYQMSKENISIQLNNLYQKAIKNTNEEVNNTVAKEVTRKIMARGLPIDTNDKSLHKFGVHAFDAPFILDNMPDKEVDNIFNLASRAGVETLRTGESYWHRYESSTVGNKYGNLLQQINFAKKYNMNFMFNIGYPFPEYNYDNKTIVSTFKPEYEPLFRKYLQDVFSLTKDYAQYYEYGNEVDAPSTWWRNATPELYVRDLKIVKEEMAKANITTPLVVLSSTYARNEETGGIEEGRRFVRKCFELGINNYADAYSIHYSWGISDKDFAPFYRREMEKRGKLKPILNSEEAGWGHPYELVKSFARDFYINKCESVYYYLAQDWYENGNLILTGLFDYNWKPKLRLLAYAMSVDAMKDRELVGMCSPSKEIEAYVLKSTVPNAKDKYSILMWRFDQRESIGFNDFKYPKLKPIIVDIKNIKSAKDWRLNPVKFSGNKIGVTDNPIVVFTNTLPDWKLISAEEWIKDKNIDATTKVVVPGT